MNRETKDLIHDSLRLLLVFAAIGVSIVSLIGTMRNLMETEKLMRRFTTTNTNPDIIWQSGVTGYIDQAERDYSPTNLLLEAYLLSTNRTTNLIVLTNYDQHPLHSNHPGTN